MGNATWNSGTYTRRKATYAGKTREQLFQKRSINKDFDPKNITIRESCDSEANPASTALIFALDVTGSMGFIAEKIAKEGLGTLVGGILEKLPVTDPHLMMMAIGDINYDDYPLQATQFEADIRIADQLLELYLEGGGGGNQYESYDLAWSFAASKTKIDCFDKRGKKGYVFTIGDELPPIIASNKLLTESVNINLQSDMTCEQVLSEAQKMYNVFHIIVEEGNYARRHGARGVHNSWEDLLGKKAICLDNYNNISQVILSVIMVNEGADPEDAINQWDSESVKNSVRHALYGPSGQ